MTGPGNALGRRGFLSRRGFLGIAALAAAALPGCASARDPIAATYIPESYDDLYPGVEHFLGALHRETGGERSYEVFDAGTLLGAEQLLPGLLMDIAELIFQTSSYVSSSYPALSVMELPFVTGNFAQHRRAIDPDGPLHAEINDQLRPRGLRLLGSLPTSLEYLWTAAAPIREPADVRGMRIRVAGEIEGETVKALGGAPVTMGSSEVYEALERGTIDGLMSYVGTLVSRDLQQIVRYGTVAHFGAYTFDAYCRADWYEQQPEPVRRALRAASRSLHRQGTDSMLAVHERDYLPAIAEAGVQLVEPGARELAAFRRATAPVHEKWRAAVGPAVADRMLARVDEA
ncbi:TRAP transporter substrate-binding protein [Saccharopolyspora sp. HNM0983]|uniref:TRAP transporter substrate-binding protein n=1 Tax=Saccharopolyspora montiporae TaxID=2781240 RepID=A0A929FY06_9PSEU|nr:TRAP transporter substrate-binding protein [Saccharopolyspora sp. HNM0983]MBE9372980.1 TRAP transporter substrate-binding protein [Saccharopolyspora sp. HNM0983]